MRTMSTVFLPTSLLLIVAGVFVARGVRDVAAADDAERSVEAQGRELLTMPVPELLRYMATADADAHQRATFIILTQRQAEIPSISAFLHHEYLAVRVEAAMIVCRFPGDEDVIDAIAEEAVACPETAENGRAINVLKHAGRRSTR